MFQQHHTTGSAATDSLYQAYSRVIFGRCLRLLKDRQAAEDATQETFVRVLKHIDGAPRGSDVLWWISRIATNLCLNMLRDRKTASQPLSACDEAPPAPEHHFEEALIARLFAAQLLASVPERVRATSLLRHVGGMRDGEVAQTLGVSRRTVVYHLAELRRSAHRLLEA